MKSYFAKLADRATQASIPASSAVHATKVSDPFADTALLQSPSPPPEPAESTRVTRGFDPSPPPQVARPESAVARSRTNEGPQAEALERSTPLAPNPLSHIPSTERVAEIVSSSQKPKSLEERHTTPMEPPIRQANSSTVDSIEPL